MHEQPAKEKSLDFAIRTMEACRDLTSDRQSPDLIREFFNAGTGVGMYVRNAEGSPSKTEFLASMQAAYQKARVADYWLRVLRAAGMLDEDTCDAMLEDCDALLRILGSSCKTLRSNLATKKAA